RTRAADLRGRVRDPARDHRPRAVRLNASAERWVDAPVHHLPAALVEAYGRRCAVPCLADGFVDMGGGLAYPLFPEMLDASRRLELMDADGIAVSVLSVTPPGVDGLAVADAIAVARACNDELAGLDGRLAALATLPAAQPEPAAEELRRPVAL